jgi:hypothetical protein
MTDPIAEKLRQAYHNDLGDVPLLLEAAEKIEKLLLHMQDYHQMHDRERDLRLEAEKALSDWTTDIGVRGFARRSELDAAKAEIERLRGLFEAQKIRSVDNARRADDLKARADELKAQRDELKAQVERWIAKEAARIGEALVK